MLLTLENTNLIGERLDHPECLCLDQDGTLYAGGEAGQVYRIDTDGTQTQIGSTNGFLLGIAIDGEGCIHACDCVLKGVYRIDPDGNVVLRSNGAVDRAFSLPNYPVFDAHGNLFVSDSGDYWEQTVGSGCIMRISPDNSTTVFHDGPFLFANGMAIDPSQQWLYVVQSTAHNIVRIPLDRPNGPIEVTHQLRSDTVPDGIAFASNDALLIACYKPDVIYLGHCDGQVEVLHEDPTGEIISRPTNVAIGNRCLYIANLGGWHITAVPASNFVAAPIHRPVLSLLKV